MRVEVARKRTRLCVLFDSALRPRRTFTNPPMRIQVATTGTPRITKTPVATFEFFRIQPRLHQHGVKFSTTMIPYRIATLEKAFFDTLYLSTRKGKRFENLPELELQAAGFDLTAFQTLIKESKIEARVRSAICARTATLKLPVLSSRRRGTL